MIPIKIFVLHVQLPVTIAVLVVMFVQLLVLVVVLVVTVLERVHGNMLHCILAVPAGIQTNGAHLMDPTDIINVFNSINALRYNLKFPPKIEYNRETTQTSPETQTPKVTTENPTLNLRHSDANARRPH